MPKTSRADRIAYAALHVGPARRRLFVLDGVLDRPAARLIHRRFAALPMTLSDSDRPDTAHVRHLKHEFDADEWRDDPVLARVDALARAFLRERRIAAGPTYRMYANFNLYGDYQFAHEDGDGWTALLFANSRWDEDWGGELLIYPDAGDSFAFGIAPRPGRMAVFDGMIRHRGGVPSKYCQEARITLAVKFRPAR